MMEMPEYKHLSYEDILNVVYWSQFGFVHDVVSAGDQANMDTYKSVMLNYFGSFIAHPKRIEGSIEYFKNKENDEEHSRRIQSEE